MFIDSIQINQIQIVRYSDAVPVYTTVAISEVIVSVGIDFDHSLARIEPRATH